MEIAGLCAGGLFIFDDTEMALGDFYSIVCQPKMLEKPKKLGGSIVRNVHFN